MVFALLMAVSANTSIYLPFTPVPITLQVLTVIFSALMMGGPWAAASQLTYICMGAAGLPVFAGFAGGPSVLAGPTGGYIAGFLLAAYVTGSLFTGNNPGRTIRGNTAAAALAAGICGLLVIYLSGGLHLLGIFHRISPEGGLLETARSVWLLGIKPFVLADLLKISAAAVILGQGIKKT